MLPTPVTQRPPQTHSKKEMKEFRKIILAKMYFSYQFSGHKQMNDLEQKMDHKKRGFCLKLNQLSAVFFFAETGNGKLEMIFL